MDILFLLLQVHFTTRQKIIFKISDLLQGFSVYRRIVYVIQITKYKTAIINPAIIMGKNIDQKQQSLPIMRREDTYRRLTS